MATLPELLDLLPDNSTGDIDAADLRTCVTELWNYTEALQQQIIGVNAENTMQGSQISQLQSDMTDLAARVAALEAGP